MKKTIFLISFLVVIITPSAFSQKSNESLKEKADKFYAKGKYMKALEYYIEATEIEEKKTDQDYYFLGNCYEGLAYSCYQVGYYDWVVDFVNAAIYYYWESGSTDAMQLIIPWVAQFYSYTMNTDFDFTIPELENPTTDNIVFRIKLIQEDFGDSLLVVLDAGSFDGIIENARGKALGVYSSGYSGRGNLELGIAEVKELRKNEAVVMVFLHDPTRDISKLYTGDMVELPAFIPNRYFRSVFYGLALLNIDFLNLDNEPLYHTRHIITYDAEEIEKAILHIMRNDIRETAEWIRTVLDENPEWDMPIDSGRYHGLSLVEVMENVTTHDIYSFLLFVQCFPGKYMGNSWKISETFATWVIGYAPISSFELRDSLVNASEDRLHELVQMYKKEIIDGGFVENWNSDAIEFSNIGEYEKAYHINEMVNKVTELMGEEKLKAWAVFNLAELLSNEGRYKEAIKVYEKGLNLFKAINDSAGIAYTYNNIGSQYSNLDMYDSSAYFYQKAAEIKLKLIERNPTEELLFSLALSISGQGDCKYNTGNYPEALDLYKKASEYYGSSNSFKEYSANAEVYYWMGNAHEKLSNYAEAAYYFNLRYEYYVSIGDLDGQADALDNIAYNTENTKEANELYLKAYEIKIAQGDTNDAGFSMSNAGQTYWTIGEYEKAIEAHNLALQLRRIAGNKSGQAYSFSKLAGLYKDSGDPQKAISLYKEAVSIYAEIGERKEEAQIYADIGATYNNVKDYAQAIPYYNRSIAIFDSIGDQYSYAYTLFDLGNLFFDKKNYNQAKSCFEESLQIREEIGDRSGQSYNFINIGLIERIMNYNNELAEKYYRKAMQIAHETDNDDNIAHCSNALASLFYNYGQFDSAQFYYNRALYLYRALEDRTNEAKVLISTGWVHQSIGEFEVAEDYFDSAYVLAERGSDRINMSSALTAKSSLKWKYGDYDESFEIEQKSLELSLEVENIWGVASSYLSIGNIYNLKGEYQKSIEYYQKSDSLYQTISGPEARATPLNNIGVIYFSQGDFDRALGYFNQAKTLVETTYGDKDFLSLIKGNIGEIYYYEKQYDSAHIYLDQSLKMSAETGNVSYQASTRLTLARLYLEEENFDKAFENLEIASQLLFGSNEKGALAGLNTLFGRYFVQKEDYVNARIHLEKSLDIAQEIGTKNILWEPLYLLSDVHRNQNSLDSAIATLEESIEALEYIKNKIIGGEGAVQLFSSVEIISKVYELMVQMLLEKGDVEGALLYLEKGNNESLRGKFRNLDIAFADSTKNNYLSTDKEFKTKIETLNSEIEKEKSKPHNEQSEELIVKLEQIKTIAQNDYRNFINNVIQEQPSLRNYFSMSENPMDFKAQKRNIPPDMAVLLYLLSDDNLYLFVGTRDSVFAKVIEIQKSDVEEKIMSLYDLIKRPSFTGSLDISIRGAKVVDQENEKITDKKTQFIQLSTELYQLLIQPVEKEISGKKRLAIIPNGILYYLPFQVLCDKDEEETYAYLISKYSIFYTNRLSYLTSMFYPVEDCPDLMAIGNADKTLPYAEVEVKTLEKLFDNAIVLVQDEATKQKVFEENSCYSILHFATHGVLDYNDYDNSYLILAADPATGDDGKLKIEEVFGLRSIENCKLVTLSACETAVSMQMMEGWPITTASAFLQAGVPSVIASLWSVDDKATSLLMEKFYENMKTMNTLDALHKAQVDMAMDEKYNHPYYWAPFQLVGSWK